jgi:hypothetical protein
MPTEEPEIFWLCDGVLLSLFKKKDDANAVIAAAKANIESQSGLLITHIEASSIPISEAEIAITRMIFLIYNKQFKVFVYHRLQLVI